ncbi:MAG: M15 family metallopeptidase, partial [Mogibacterium sp.]|nr:M15 family metallopeptidase [Mogibacterium sp.]
RVLHVGFDGQTRIGELIVNRKAAKDVLAVFRELYEEGYRIRKMVLVDAYYDIEMEQYAALDRGNQADCVSIEDDNTSAFNYRVASNNSNVISNHGLGFAIDLNPYENPYVNADGSLDGPDGSAEYLDRSKAAEENHMLKDGDTAVSAFKRHGFSWGGDWQGDKDYQHFDYEGT